MQRYAETRNREESEKLFIRIGFETGPLLSEKGELYGDAINMAARVAAETTRERILTTEATARRLEPDLVPYLRVWAANAALKNKSDAVELVELCWRKMTNATAEPEPPQKRCERAVITHGDKQYQLIRGAKPLTIGRSENNEIYIADPSSHISGSHGQIEFRGGQIELVDTSTNGTYVSIVGEPFKLVHKKRLALRDGGRMCLGRPPDDPAAVFLEFTVE